MITIKITINSLYIYVHYKKKNIVYQEALRQYVFTFKNDKWKMGNIFVYSIKTIAFHSFNFCLQTLTSGNAGYLS